MMTFLRLPATDVRSGSLTRVQRKVLWLMVSPNAALAARTACRSCVSWCQNMHEQRLSLFVRGGRAALTYMSSSM